MPSIYIRFNARPATTLVRAPLLERLLTRAALAPADGNAGVDAAPARDWRAAAFGLMAAAAALPPIAPVALCATGLSLRPWVCLATPVHLIAGMSSVQLAADGVLALEWPEARALATDFNRVFGGGGVSLRVGGAANLICEFDQVLEVTTTDPAEVAGNDLWGFTPAGRDAPQLKRLMSEIEMWLFDHALNQARSARGLPPVTGLWLWGGGTTRTELPTLSGWTAGRDPLFSAFGNCTAFPDSRGPAVIVLDALPGAPGWPELEQRWLAPALAGLKAGRYERLYLSAGRRCFSLNARALLRVWRRVRPWWEWFGIEGQETHGNP